jgi:hypothetical protein
MTQAIFRLALTYDVCTDCRNNVHVNSPGITTRDYRITKFPLR